MKRRTRHYAKRQLTWMRKLAGVRIVDVTGRSAADVAKEIAGMTAEPAPREPAQEIARPAVADAPAAES
jgi:hypothetical protein